MKGNYCCMSRNCSLHTKYPWKHHGGGYHGNELAGSMNTLGAVAQQTFETVILSDNSRVGWQNFSTRL